MEIYILIPLVFGFVICLILGFGLIEIYCFFNKRNKLEKPYIVSITTSLIIGVFIILLMMINKSGEDLLVGMVIAPYILIGFSFGGAIIGFIYKSINQTIFLKKLVSYVG